MLFDILRYHNKNYKSHAKCLEAEQLMDVVGITFTKCIRNIFNFTSFDQERVLYHLIDSVFY